LKAGTESGVKRGSRRREAVTTIMVKVAGISTSNVKAPGTGRPTWRGGRGVHAATVTDSFTNDNDDSKNTIINNMNAKRTTFLLGCQ
jgi:ribosomal protein L4